MNFTCSFHPASIAKPSPRARYPLRIPSILALVPRSPLEDWHAIRTSPKVSSNEAAYHRSRPVSVRRMQARFSVPSRKFTGCIYAEHHHANTPDRNGLKTIPQQHASVQQCQSFSFATLPSLPLAIHTAALYRSLAEPSGIVLGSMKKISQRWPSKSWNPCWYIKPISTGSL